jgi:hypothetical protein
MFFEVNKLYRRHVCVYNYKLGDVAKLLSEYPKLLTYAESVVKE